MSSKYSDDVVTICRIRYTIIIYVQNLGLFLTHYGTDFLLLHA